MVVDRDHGVARAARLGFGEERHLFAPALAAAERGRAREVVDRHAGHSSTSGSRAEQLPHRTFPVRARRVLHERGLRARRVRGGQLDRFASRPQDVVGHAAHALERRGLVARSCERRRGDDRAVVREQDAGSLAHLVGEPLAVGRAFDRAVLVHERELAVEDRRVLVHDARRLAHAREQRGVVRVVVHDDRGVVAGPMQLGVQEHRGRDVPLARDDRAAASRRMICEARTSSHHTPHGFTHMPPSPSSVVGAPRDVARQVLAPALVGEDPQCARERLGRRQLAADTGTGTRFCARRCTATSCETRRGDGGRGRCRGRSGRARRRARSTAAAVPVRALVRRPEAAATVDADEVALADLSDPASLAPAFAGARALFLAVVADAGAGGVGDERDRRGRGGGHRAHRQGVEHPDRRPRCRLARQPPRDRTAPGGLAGGHDRAPAFVLHHRARTSARADRTRSGRAAVRRRAGSRGSTPTTSRRSPRSR